MKLLPVLFCLAAIGGVAAYAESDKTNSQTGDVAPPAVQKLVPRGWKLESFAIGPLTAGREKDLVMSVANKAEGAFGNAEARQLIVATPSRSGYKIVAKGDHALQRGLGPAGSDPFVSSAKHEIITEAFGGSRYKFTENYHFALVKNKWLMTRYRILGYDSLMENHGSNTLDVNVLTGHVVGTMSRDHHKTKRVSFNELIARDCGKNKSIPADAAKLCISDAAKQTSAVIRSVHTVDELIVEVAVTDADDTKTTRVFVKDKDGRLVKVKRSKRVASPHGFTQRLVLALPPDYLFDHQGENSNVFLDWTIHIDQTDKANPKQHNRFSTESPAGKGLVKGGILAVTQNSEITLQNAAVDSGTFQSPPIDIPEEL